MQRQRKSRKQFVRPFLETGLSAAPVVRKSRKARNPQALPSQVLVGHHRRGKLIETARTAAPVVRRARKAARPEQSLPHPLLAGHHRRGHLTGLGQVAARVVPKPRRLHFPPQIIYPHPDWLVGNAHRSRSTLIAFPPQRSFTFVAAVPAFALAAATGGSYSFAAQVHTTFSWGASIR
jgi:hypothetical protein